LLCEPIDQHADTPLHEERADEREQVHGRADTPEQRGRKVVREQRVRERRAGRAESEHDPQQLRRLRAREYRGETGPRNA